MGDVVAGEVEDGELGEVTHLVRESEVDRLGILSFGGQEMSGNVGKCGPIVCFEFWFAIICWCLCLQEMLGNVGKY